MKPFPALSPSSIADFEGCPKRWYLTKILKKYPWKETEAITYGNEVHAKLEAYTKFKTPLPSHLEYVAPIIDELRDGGYTLCAELEIAIDREWNAVDYDRYGKKGNVFLRGKIDLVAVNAKQAIILDWKTGKPKPDPFQLNIYGALVYHILGLERVDAAYAWLKTKEFHNWSVTAANFTEIKDDITARTAKMRALYEREEFPARTSPLCCWCPALQECDEAVYYKENIGRYRK